MDSLTRAKDLQDLHKRLTWQFLEAKGISRAGVQLSSSNNRKLEMVSTTSGVHTPKSPYPLTFLLSAQIPDGHYGCIHLNDPKFLCALAKAITDKLPDLLDDTLVILENEGEEAFRAAEKELRNSQQRLEALRPEIKVQQELIHERA